MQFQIAAHLVEQAGLGCRVPWIRPEEFPKIRDEWRDDRRTKVFKTHRMTDAIREEFDRRNAAALYIYRDLRDVVASRIRKSNATFEGVFSKGSLIDEVLSLYDQWTAKAPCLISRYEDVVADLPAEVARIANFLEIAIDTGQCAKIAEEYSIDRQLERIESLRNDVTRQMSSGKAEVYDRDSLLHTNHIASGRHGSWTDVLTDLHVAMIERRAGDWLVDRGYELVNPKLSFRDRLRLKRMERKYD